MFLWKEASYKRLDTTLRNQLDQVLASAKTGFLYLKVQEIKLETGEIVYESLTTLNETSANTIGLSQSKPHYKVNISKKVNEDRAGNAVKE